MRHLLTALLLLLPARDASAVVVVGRAIDPVAGTATFLVETDVRFERSAFRDGLEQPLAVVCVKEPGPCDEQVGKARAALAAGAGAPVATLRLDSVHDEVERRREQVVAAAGARPALTLRVDTRPVAPAGADLGSGSPAALLNPVVDVVVEAVVAGAVQASVGLPGLSSSAAPWSADAGLWCEGVRCLVVLTADVGVDARGLDVAVSSPFDASSPVLMAPPGICAGHPVVGVTANPGLVSTRGAAVADALRRAGCVVSEVGPAKRARDRSVVYGSPTQAVTGAIAGWLGTGQEPLTWKSNAAVVVAVGAR